ncbi:AraC family transcriptional regulator [bacterium]|nr:AraC family transcriptional regulator [bacterium]
MADENLFNTIIVPAGCNEQMLNHAHTHAKLLNIKGILISGISSLCSGYLISRKSQDFHTIIFTTKGKGEITANQRKYIIQEGDLLIIPAYLQNRYKISGKNWDIVWFHLDDCLQWHHLRGNRVVVHQYTSIQSLTDAMQGFLKESVSKVAESDNLVRIYAELIFLHLKRELSKNLKIKSDTNRLKLSETFAHANKHLDRKWNCETLAKLLSVSPSYFSRLTKEAYGTSPIKLLTQFRMERAALLLKTTDYPIYTIALQIGYEDEFAFSTAFKRQTGISPSHYRRQPY